MSTIPSYSIELTQEQVNILHGLINNDSVSDKTKLRANILLMSNTSNGQKVSVSNIADKLGTSRQTVTKIRNIYQKQGFDVAINVLKHNRTAGKKRNDEELISRVRELLSEAPPPQIERWTIRALCSTCVERGYIDKIGRSTMMRLLNENSLSLINE